MMHPFQYHIPNYATLRYYIISQQNKIVPPWVGEHPDIFDDPNFSISALNLTQSHNDPSNESLMDLSLGGGASALTTPTEYDNGGGGGGPDVCGREVDPLTPQLQLEDDPSIEEELYEVYTFRNGCGHMKGCGQ